MMHLLLAVLLWLTGAALVLAFAPKAGRTTQRASWRRQAVTAVLIVATGAAAGWGGWTIFQIDPAADAAGKAERAIERCARWSRIKVDDMAAAYETPDTEMLRAPWDGQLWSFNQLGAINCGRR